SCSRSGWYWSYLPDVPAVWDDVSADEERLGAIEAGHQISEKTVNATEPAARASALDKAGKC
ncbi:MAG: hypothetical protein ACO1NO_05460, partial [Burkholderiaceae bacterium]